MAVRVIAFMLLFGSAVSAGAATVELVPTTAVTNVSPGDVVSFDVQIDFSAEGGTLGGGFDVTWSESDLGLVGFSSAALGDPAFGRDPDYVPGSGLLESWAVGDFNGIQSGLVGNVSFQVLLPPGGVTLVAVGPTSGIAGPWVSAVDFVSIIDPDYNQVEVTTAIDPGGLCGDSQPDPGEECDDGNTAPGDGCSATCQVEDGFTCTLALPGNPPTPSVCATDSDGDGVADSDDNCPLDPNPDQSDRDQDGVGDVCDNCPDVFNPGQEDSNGDGIGDACSAPDNASVLLVPTTPVNGLVPGDLVNFDIVIDFSPAGGTLGGGFDIGFDALALAYVGHVQAGLGDPAFMRDPDVLPGLLESWAVGDFAGLSIAGPELVGDVTFQVLPSMGPSTLVSTTGTAGVAGPWVSAVDYVSIIEPDYDSEEVTRLVDTDPQIELLKQVSLDGVNFFDADNPGGSDAPIGAVGLTDATYRLIVSNTGDENLVNVTVNDLTLGISSESVADLPVGATVVIEAGHDGRFEELFFRNLCDSIGNKVNVADVTATGALSQISVGDEDPANVNCISLCGNGIVDPGEDCDDDSGCCSSACTFEPPATDCDDGNACTQSDTCDGAGLCVGADPVVCTPLGECYEAGICDSGTGQCSEPPLPAGTACGDPDSTECSLPDSCDGTGSCLVNDEPAGTACGDDSDSVCDNPDSCDGQGFCEQNPEPATTLCDDGNECTSTSMLAGDPDYCDGAGACDINYVVPGGACGDDSVSQCTEADSCDGAGRCLYNNIECGSVTSSGLCEFDVDPDKGRCDGGDLDGAECSLSANPGACEAGGGECVNTDQFRLPFAPDGQNWVAYKLNASNPGQFYYNLIYDALGAVGEVVLYIAVPYPFVTQGAVPLHIYDADAVPDNGFGCLDPQQALASEAAVITLEDWIQPAGYEAPDHLQCWQVDDGVDDDNDALEDICVIRAEISPETIGLTENALLYVNLHLDYGLKGPGVDADGDGEPDRYDRSGYVTPWGSSDALFNTDTDDGNLAIEDCSEHVFFHADDADIGAIQFFDSVENLNAFKQISGAFGRVWCEDTGDGIMGALNLVRIDSGTVMTSTQIDDDGYYVLGYKHRGKAAQYRIEWSDAGEMHATAPFWLQGNGVVEIDLVAGDEIAPVSPCADLDGTEAETDWLPIDPIYVKGKFKGN